MVGIRYNNNFLESKRDISYNSICTSDWPSLSPGNGIRSTGFGYCVFFRGFVNFQLIAITEIKYN